MATDYAVDWAIVQTQKWSTLYVLSRERQPPAVTIDVSVSVCGEMISMLTL
jgi:hypothetical protein